MAENQELQKQLEECRQALRASEARFRNIIERNNDGILIVDREGVVRFVNRAAEEILARHTDELVGSFLGFPLAAGHVTEINLVRRDGAAAVAEMRVVESEWEGSPVLLATLRDVSERKAAQAALAWEASVNEVVADLSGALITARASLDDIAYLVLEHAKRLTGSPFGFVGYIDPQTGYLVSPTMTRDIWDTCQVASKSVVFETFSGLWGWVLDHRQSLLINKPEADPRSSGVPEGHLPIRRFVSAPALMHDELVGQIALANAAEDYTKQDLAVVERLASLYALAIQRWRAEESLRESEEKYRTLVEQSLQGVVIAQANPVRLSFVNRPMEAISGFTPEELLNMAHHQLVELVHPRDRADFFQNFQDRLAGKEVAPQREYRLVRKDGSLCWALSYSSRIEYEGSPATLTVFLDISDLKKAQEMLARQAIDLARSNEELQQFAYIASHDLQEPLRMVSSYVHLLARRYQGQLDAEADEFIGYAVEGATRMQTLIHDLLRYSQAGRSDGDFGPTNCELVLAWVLDSMQVMLQESDAVVTYDPLPTIQADATQVGQVFQNLIGNAIKFRSSPPRVHITAQAGEREWVFAVQDNGIGIEAEYQQKIFKAFQRLHSREKYPGSGIGLALCKKIVEQHGGRIWVESEPGSGSTFYFTIPMERGAIE